MKEYIRKVCKLFGVDILANTNANRTFEENEESLPIGEKVKSIKSISEKFIDYLQEGMSK